ncbi:hypothetical protein D8674_021754 [Pyrus ussuriensis x Pyrus communis]|uniref:Uncharacterized protein n=1 Tax=Pyrus ussuriensis x Pyrus communis TaxID=2448454 RepID=A0A5N5GI04_9ROSA|nr:hypothetical protein D8674_021754 [Pyrus ussuriensis x Pyrus communis]
MSKFLHETKGFNTEFQGWYNMEHKLKEIAEDCRIYQHINITNFETVNLLKSWGVSNKVSTFINRCIQDAILLSRQQGRSQNSAT